MKEAAQITQDATLKNALNKAQLAFINIIPVSFMGDLNISEVLTQNEKREIAGYPPIENITENGINAMDVTATAFLKNIAKWSN